MPIELVQENEELEYKKNDSTILYRRIPVTRQNRIITANSKKGRPNWEEITKRFLDYVVLGWENITSGGKQIKYTPEMAYCLPADDVDEILQLAGASTLPGKGEDERKNSTTTSQQD